jgi:uncharacterized protein
MLIGIISDTHGSLSRSACNVLADCDAIIHAGDIGSSRVLYELESIAPVTAVLGNCDFDDFGPAVGRVAAPLFDGVRFKVVHRPTDTGHVEPDTAVVVSGHTHRSKAEYCAGTWYVNPGSASAPRADASPTVALLTTDQGTVTQVDIVEV